MSSSLEDLPGPPITVVVGVSMFNELEQGEPYEQTDVPASQQIAKQVVGMLDPSIARIKAGYVLPAPAELAKHLSVSVDCVGEAYLELWDAGFLSPMCEMKQDARCEIKYDLCFWPRVIDPDCLESRDKFQKHVAGLEQRFVEKAAHTLLCQAAEYDLTLEQLVEILKLEARELGWPRSWRGIVFPWSDEWSDEKKEERA
jgi:hypothetical protein